MWQIVAGGTKQAASICRIVLELWSAYAACSMGSIRRVVVLFAVVILTPPVSRGDAPNSRLERLYATFIAPCCWSKNLMEHNSQVAAEMRCQIDLMVQSGRSDDEIKSIFVAKYGERVLALPDGVPRMWLFWTPVAVAAAGLIAVCSSSIVREGATICRRTRGLPIGSNSSQCEPALTPGVNP
jgi:cytochrome c-type biogenesis protein CcmH/NrfF